MPRSHLSSVVRRLKHTLLATFFVGTQIVFPLSLSGLASAATLSSNDVSISSTGFVISNSSSYSVVAGQPTGKGQFKNGNVSSYPEGSCIPAVFDVKNTGSSAGDTLVTPVYDYYNGVVGVSNYELVTYNGNAETGVTNLNQLTYTGNSLSSATSFPIVSGGSGSVTASVTGPYSGNDTTTTNTSSTDAFRHYNVALSNIPAGATVQILLCARLGLDASQYSGGSSLSLRTVQGGAENIPIPVNQILVLPSITVNKTVVGGTAAASDFSFNLSPDVNGHTGSYTIASGQTSMTIPNVNPDGSYTITESGPSGYLFTSGSGTNCTANSGTLDTAAGAMTATVAAGTTPTNATCSFTNTFQNPQLTLKKIAVNDNGGAATADQWTLEAQHGTDTPVIDATGTLANGSTVANSNATTSTVSVAANTAYTLSESGPSGYSASDWSCNGGTYDSAAKTITLGGGDNVTCTITNNDIAPTLTLVKNVTNDNGGTATADQWTLEAQHGTDTPVINMQGAPSNNGATATTSTVTVAANTAYNLSESGGPNGYAASNWSCTSGGTVVGDTVTLALDSNVTCSITNDDIAPLLTVTKVVNNQYGGTLVVSDFPLYVDSLQVTSGQQNSFDAGSYTISETQQTGYTLSSASGDCSLSNGTISIQMQVGGVYTCTLTNNDLPATIKVTKVVNNNHGGTKTASDFNLYVGNTKVVSGVTNTFTANQAYTVSEDQQSGYHQDSIVCVDPTDQSQTNLGATFTPANGQEIDCTITNSDVAPQLTVIKHVINNNGGTKVASDFTMNVTGTNVSNSSFAGAENPGTTVTLNAGSYSVGEGSHTGYSETLSGDCSGTIALGESKTCTITNDDIAPTLTVVKDVVNNNGGNNTADNFAIQVNGGTLSGGTLSNSNLTDTYTYSNPVANTSYTVSEADPTSSGYAQTSLVCTDNDTQATVSNPVTLSPGQNVTCIITNNDIAPTLTVVKNVVNAYGGNNTANDFTMRVNGTALTGGALSNNNLTDTYTYSNAQANTAYTVSEDAFSGYASSGWTCTDNNTHATVANPVSLNEGQNVTCVITNSDVAPTLTVVKQVQDTYGGNVTADQFTLNVNGTALTGGTLSNGGATDTYSYANPLSNTSYTISESDPSSLGYQQVSIACTDNQAHTTVNNPVFLKEGQNVTCVVTNGDKAPSLTIVKDVVNDNGGNLTADQFAVQVNNTTLSGGVLTNNSLTDTYVYSNPLSNTAYTVGEVDPTPNGYAQTSLTCTDNDSHLTVSDPVTLSPGQNVTCMITNNDIAPSLTVIKNVTNDNGGNLKANNFTMRVNGVALTGGMLSNNDLTDTYTYANAMANTSYAVSEDTSSGYASSGWTCADNNTNKVIPNPVTLNPGQNVTCVVTNNDIAPTLTVIKNVVNTYGGNNTANDFTMRVNGAALTGGILSNNDLTDTYTYANAMANTSYAVSEDTNSGYASSGWTCTDDDTNSAVNNPVTLSPGQNVTCVVTNNDIAPTLKVIKNVINDNGGTALASNFTLTVNGAALTGGTSSNSGTTDTYTYANAQSNTSYSVNEDWMYGYDQTSLICKDNDTNTVLSSTSGYQGSNITLTEGQNVTCTITNNDIAPMLTLVKYVDNTNGNDQTADQWTLTAQHDSDTPLINEKGTLFYNVGPYSGAYTNSYNATAGVSYTLSEAGPVGYTASSWQCDNGEEEAQINQNGVFDPSTNTVAMSVGDNVTCWITNSSNAPVMNITKSNDQTSPTTVGNTVTYTIKVSLPSTSGEVFNATVTDLPPANFKYVLGSWTATSNIPSHDVASDVRNGNFADGSLTGDPTYGSPGLWHIGNLIPGEVITLTYRALIGQNVSDGVYPDTAFVSGYSQPNNGGTQVLGNITNLQNSSLTPFVGTSVQIISTMQPKSYTAGQVLGAEVLVNTGASLSWLEFVLPFLLIGGVLIAKQTTSGTKGGN